MSLFVNPPKGHPLDSPREAGLRHLRAIALRQDRYKALVLEDETALLQVVDYIHLNPVRAGLVTVEDLKAYALSSFPAFFRRKGRARFLDPAEFLHEAGGLSDSPAGMGAYHRRLTLVMEEDPAKREKEFAALCRGWYVGSGEGKAYLAGQIQEGKVKANTDALVELKEMEWATLLSSGLNALGKDPADCQRERKLAEWKLALGSWVKSKTGAGNQWLTQRLNMGHPNTASRQMMLYRKERSKGCEYWNTLREILAC